MPDPTPTPTSDGGLILSLRGICKNFGAVSALTDIDLDIHAGRLWRWSATTAPASPPS